MRPDLSTDRPSPIVGREPLETRSRDANPTRRRFLAVGAATVAAALAGCSAIAGPPGDPVLKDVTVVNGADRRLAGSIQVLDPAGDVLRDRFDLPPAEDDGGGSMDAAIGVSGEVLTDPGEYTVGVKLDREVGGEHEAMATVEVADPEGEHIAVVVGADDADGSILIVVAEGIDDLAEYDDAF